MSQAAPSPLLKDRSFWAILVTQFLGAFNDNVFKQLILLLMVPVVISDFVEPNPNEMAQAQGRMLEGPGLAGIDVPGEQVADEQVAGEQVAGEQVAGEQVAGEQVAGEQGNAERAGVVFADWEAEGWRPDLDDGRDYQGIATLIFSIPFVVLSGFAGYLSDRYSKSKIIVLAKVAEIAVMLLGLVAFLAYDSVGALGLWIVLFLMGIQSTFFGPGKYGILPDLFSEKDLPRANGLILMTTFLAIIFGFVVAGNLANGRIVTQADGTRSADGLWSSGVFCIGIAIAGAISSILIRSTKPATPDARLKSSDWGVSGEMIRLLTGDRPLLAALLVSCVFWLVSGIAVLVVNRLGLRELGLDEAFTSNMVACTGLGIMVGAITANLALKNVSQATQVRIGLFGLSASLLLLGFVQPNWPLFRFGAACVFLLSLGVFAAVFSIPLQVFMQSRPPSTLKGRMIATMNQANFVGIMLAGPLYQLFESVTRNFGMSISVVFWIMMMMVLPIAVFYRPLDRHRQLSPTSSNG